MPPEEYARRVLRTVAWVCRYAHLGLPAALASDRHWLGVLCEELSAIVEEENRPQGGG